jgi:acyl-CoA reductase-like NAD-dependent aldehyde dehydrogenase
LVLIGQRQQWPQLAQSVGFYLTNNGNALSRTLRVEALSFAGSTRIAEEIPAKSGRRSKRVSSDWQCQQSPRRDADADLKIGNGMEPEADIGRLITAPA